MDMNNPTCKIVVESPQEAHWLTTLQTGAILEGVNISKVLKRIDNNPQNLTRKNIRISNEFVNGNLLIMRVLPTKKKNVFDFVIYPNMTNTAGFDYTNYDILLNEALNKGTVYMLQGFSD